MTKKEKAIVPVRGWVTRGRADGEFPLQEGWNTLPATFIHGVRTSITLFRNNTWKERPEIGFQIRNPKTFLNDTVHGCPGFLSSSHIAEAVADVANKSDKDAEIDRNAGMWRFSRVNVVSKWTPMWTVAAWKMILEEADLPSSMDAFKQLIRIVSVEADTVDTAVAILGMLCKAKEVQIGIVLETLGQILASNAVDVYGRRKRDQELMSAIGPRADVGHVYAGWVGMILDADAKTARGMRAVAKKASFVKAVIAVHKDDAADNERIIYNLMRLAELGADDVLLEPLTLDSAEYLTAVLANYAVRPKSSTAAFILPSKFSTVADVLWTLGVETVSAKCCDMAVSLVLSSGRPDHIWRKRIKDASPANITFFKDTKIGPMIEEMGEELFTTKAGGLDGLETLLVRSVRAEAYPSVVALRPYVIPKHVGHALAVAVNMATTSDVAAIVNELMLKCPPLITDGQAIIDGSCPNIPFELLLDMANQELRSIFISLKGNENFVMESGFETVMTDRYGVLMKRVDTRGIDIWMVRVENSTIEPDGSRKIHYLRIAPLNLDGGVWKSPHEAVAATFGMSAKDYNPLSES